MIYFRRANSVSPRSSASLSYCPINENAGQTQVGSFVRVQFDQVSFSKRRAPKQAAIVIRNIYNVCSAVSLCRAAEILIHGSSLLPLACAAAAGMTLPINYHKENGKQHPHFRCANLSWPNETEQKRFGFFSPPYFPFASISFSP